jgi:HEAT repeat protein
MGLPHLALLLALLAGPPPAPPAAASSPAEADDEQAFRDARLDPSAAGALEFFRDRTTPPDPDRIASFVRQLGAAEGDARDKAVAALVRTGPAAVGLLRPAANALENDGAAARARRCLELIEGPGGARLARSAARLVAARRPGGAAGVLLAYLPFADDADVAREVEEALVAVARRDGKLEPDLLTGLADPSPVRRAAAAAALCRAGGTDAFDAVRAALKDPASSVRLRAALGLAGHNNADAVPVLIDLLTDASADRRKEAEGFLKQLAGEWALATPQGNDEVAARLRRDAWLTWWRNLDGPALLEEFRSRTLTNEEIEQARGLIGQLDNESAEIRDKAAAGLARMGGRVAPLLRRAASGKGRAAELAAGCLEDAAGAPARPLPAVAVRLLTLRRPAGTLEALLAYLPCADSEDAEGAIVDSLPDAGVRDGKADPSLVAALGDQVAVRRAAAAAALSRAGATDQLPAVRKLLADPDPDVRLRSALALAHARDKDAVPVLIELLVSYPRVDKVAEAEDFLVRLAGDQSPDVALGSDGPARAKARDAWAEWWKAHAADADLAAAAATPRNFGYLLAVEMWVAGKGAGRVAEVDRNGKLRWEVENLMAPQDVQYLPGDRILVAEQNANRVTERDLTGKILWERSVMMAFQCQRLRNGHTFMAGRNLILEVDRSGKEVFSVHRPDYLISARRFRNGQIAFLTNQGIYVRLDASGKEVKNIHLPVAGTNGLSTAEVLPGDRMIVSMLYQNKVAEYDADGKSTWEATVTLPGYATRLPNGHTLVVTGNATGVAELNRSGKVIAEWKDLPVHPWRVDRR